MSRLAKEAAKVRDLIEPHKELIRTLTRMIPDVVRAEVVSGKRIDKEFAARYDAVITEINKLKKLVHERS